MEASWPYASSGMALRIAIRRASPVAKILAFTVFAMSSPSCVSSSEISIPRAITPTLKASLNETVNSWPKEDPQLKIYESASSLLGQPCDERISTYRASGRGLENKPHTFLPLDGHLRRNRPTSPPIS